MKRSLMEWRVDGQVPHPDRHRWQAAHGAGSWRDIWDRDGGRCVLMRSRKRYLFIQRAYADGGYAGRLVEWAKTKTHIVLEVVRRNAKSKLRGAATTLDCAANLRLDHEQPTLRTRLRAAYRSRRDPLRHRRMRNTHQAMPWENSASQTFSYIKPFLLEQACFSTGVGLLPFLKA